ncbi:Mpo1 family 2-hydroxy fatty acid dioxygenase [Stutzerimonas azotifigens]|uniref:Mpo1 family 2-hydroxy fatty acid dioxygenase n=1 Tax=Stutzerimonas azotifigens TaxID=291995 RepID=UPI00041CFC98|nr:Mpo1-like protein [Stutzerimonas azotifigens]
MKTLIDHLAQYAAYHRDPRNLLTHFFGIPLILLAVTVLLSRQGLALGDLWLSPALPAALAAAVFYLRLDLRYGLCMLAVLGACLWLGAALATGPTAPWLALGLGLFVVGWVIQFVGHYYEGRKPAFVDDLIGLLVGPLFVLAELGFMLGWREPVREQIEARAGPVRRRVKATPHA